MFKKVIHFTKKYDKILERKDVITMLYEYGNEKVNNITLPIGEDFVDSLADGEKVTALAFEIKGINNINIRVGYDSTTDMLNIMINEINRLLFGYGILYKIERNVFIVKATKEKTVNFIKTIHKQLRDYMKKVFIEQYALSFEIACGAVVEFVHKSIDKYKVVSTLTLALGKSNYDTLHPLVFLSEDSYDNNLYNMKKLDQVKNSVIAGCEGFYLEYQPLVSGINSKIIGAEALVRWSNEKYGVVSPGLFIPYIENFSCFYDLGMWILRKAVIDAKEFIKIKPDFFLNVNLSYSQLENESFKYDVIKLLDELNFPCTNLQFELTERCKNLNVNYLKKQLDFFRNKGIRIALDDFGTGTSTLKLIADLPIDCVKIDQSFIRNILSNPSNVVIVETVLDCAKRLGISVCLEGIENKEIKDFVTKYYVNYQQGYYYSKPVVFDEFMKIIHSTWKTKGISLIKPSNKSSFDISNIISMMPGGFFVYINDETERIILANEALLDIFECNTMDEFIELTGNSFRGLVHKDDYERVDAEIKSQIANSVKNYDQVKYRIVTKNGKVKNVIDYGHLVEKEYNDDAFYVFIVEEI